MFGGHAVLVVPRAYARLNHRPQILPIYLPAALLGVPAQASFVLLPLYVLELGGSVAAASAVVGLRGLGMMAMDIPAGMAAARIGDKATMLVACLVMTLCYGAFALSDDVAWFYPIAFLYGAGGSTFLLGRMSFITAAIGPGERGRVIAMIAGGLRMSALIGPLDGGAIATRYGFGSAFVCAGICAALATVAIGIFCPAPERSSQPLAWHSLPALGWRHRASFSTAGVTAVTFMLMRSARTVLLPLLGAGLGLDAAAVGFVVSVSAAIDVAFFYPAGVWMDRYGRRATAVPSAIAFMLVLAAMSLVDSYTWLIMVAVAAGIANGLSTGIVMTLGTDLAPAAERGEFLGLWRLMTDFGTASGPIVVSAVVAVAPLSSAALVVSGLSALGVLVVVFGLRETLPQA